ncbi:MAG TPA: hypothetical protein VIH99_10615 [Bdellovibrionota bacterium]|jgi:hypothetical protein
MAFSKTAFALAFLLPCLARAAAPDASLLAAFNFELAQALNGKTSRLPPALLGKEEIQSQKRRIAMAKPKAEVLTAGAKLCLRQEATLWCLEPQVVGDELGISLGLDRLFHPKSADGPDIRRAFKEFLQRRRENDGSAQAPLFPGLFLPSAMAEEPKGFASDLDGGFFVACSSAWWRLTNTPKEAGGTIVTYPKGRWGFGPFNRDIVAENKVTCKDGVATISPLRDYYRISASSIDDKNFLVKSQFGDFQISLVNSREQHQCSFFQKDSCAKLESRYAYHFEEEKFVDVLDDEHEGMNLEKKGKYAYQVAARPRPHCYGAPHPCFPHANEDTSHCAFHRELCNPALTHKTFQIRKCLDATCKKTGKAAALEIAKLLDMPREEIAEMERLEKTFAREIPLSGGLWEAKDLEKEGHLSPARIRTKRFMLKNRDEFLDTVANDDGYGSLIRNLVRARDFSLCCKESECREKIAARLKLIPIDADKEGEGGTESAE